MIVVLLAIKEGFSTRQAICQKTGIAPQRVNEAFNRLKEQKLIQQDGEGSNASYSITELGEKASMEEDPGPSGGKSDGPIRSLYNSIIKPSEPSITDGPDDPDGDK